MAEDIKDDENSEAQPSEELSNDGLISEEVEEETSSQETPNEESNEPDSTEVEANVSEQVDESPNEEDTSENISEHSVQQKQSKLQKILIITIGVLLSILILGFILYLFGVFDPEPPKPTMNEQTALDNNQTKKPEKYIFDSKDINIDRLNGKLRILTKYEIIGTALEERQKELEKNSKLSTKQINELLAAEMMEKTKSVDKNETTNIIKKEEKVEKETTNEIKEEKEKETKSEEVVKKENPYDLLKFIQVSVNSQALATIKPELDTLKISITNCQDNSQEFLLIGPFNSNKDLNNIFRNIYANITQSATKKDLARLEFNRICK